jgi:hypothetical protein
MEVNSQTTYKLSENDIKEAIAHYMIDQYGVCIGDVNFNVKELTEDYPIGNFESGTRHVGYEITAEGKV